MSHLSIQPDPFGLESHIGAWLRIETFAELKQLENLIITEKIVLLRKPSIQQQYDQVRAESKQKGELYADSVRFDVFESDRPKISYNSYTVLIQNIYPSHLPTDTQHWNIWVDKKDVSSDYIAEVKSFFLAKMNWQESNVIMWEKLPEHRSVPEIRHWHLFVKTE